MDTSGPPGGFDIQNFFKTATQSTIPGFNPYPPNHPFHPSSLPFPSSSFPSSSLYPSSTGTVASLPGSYSFPSQGPMYHPYTHYSQDQVPRSSPYLPPVFSQPSFSQPAPSPIHTMAYSTPSLSQLNLQSSIPSPPLDGARLMALLTTHSSGDLVMKDDPSKISILTPSATLELPPPALHVSETFQGNSQASNPPAAISPAMPSAPPVSLAPPFSSSRLSSSKLPRGRHLKGEYVVYDIDVRLQGEAQPQLEVSPITVYGSDPVLVVGRQIAVNRSYICYGLRTGTIRILNINTALRALLRGHSQRVTDMAFFAEDVHLLASASSDGRVFVRRIIEEEGKMQITEQIILAIHILGDWESAHPRVCWHSQLQDLLVVGIGNYILTIDIPKVRMTAPPTDFTAKDPLICFVASPIEGVYCVGGHDAEVTDLSTGQWTWLASASKDGMVRIWGDKRMHPISSFNPHGGQPVGSVAFLSAPLHPDHTVLLTAGEFNRELKLWVPAGGEGWFPQSGNVKWQCVQTLELRSSAEGKVEDAFFNQVLVVPHACLLLLANAKRNAIYVVHIEFGLNPFSPHMDYLAEFSVTIPILSLTATSENVSNGEGVIQIYCVQTQAIQQYALDLLQCLPPAGEPALATTYNPERDLISGSQVPDRSSSTTPPPIESVLVGGGSKSPEIGARSRSPGLVPGLSQNTMFSSSVELASFCDQMPATNIGSIAMIESKSVIAPASKEVRDILTRDNVPSLPKIVAPAPKIGSGPVSPLASPLARASKSPVLNSSPREQIDKHLQVHELSAERKIEDASKIESLPLSPRRLYEESIKKDSGKESPILRTSSLIVEQQVDASPIHLITPSELMSMVARSKAEVDGGLSSSPHSSMLSIDSSKSESKPEEGTMEIENLKIEAKEVAESSAFPSEDTIAEKETITDSTGIKDKSQTVANTDSGYVRESDSTQSIPSERGSVIQQVEEVGVSEERDCLVNIQGDGVQEHLKEMTTKAIDSPSVPLVLQSPAMVKGRKNKNKTNTATMGVHATTSSSVQLSSTVALNVTSFEGESSNGNPASMSSSNMAAQILTMQDSLIQLISMQKDLQKQIPVMAAVPVSKEGKRLEAALGQRVEKFVKAHVDAMWARIQEENAKREKLERERIQQLTTLLSNSMNKDLPASLERVLKKEISSISPAIARLITPNIEKAIPIAINEAFQKGVNEKGILQLEKSIGTKLEASLLRQLQSHFQTTGRQALLEALRSCFEGSVIPAFERSCRAMFEQVDTAFKNGMAEHINYAQQQFAASHSVLASTLQDTVASASSLAASLKGELADGQRKLLALAESAGSVLLLPGNKQSNGGLPDKVVTVQDVESLYPTIELSRLVGERRLEEAFNKALSLSDVNVVSWLCNQVDPALLFTTSPLPLSQGVLLSLVQQLGCDLGKDITKKLTWIQDAALALNPNDPVLAPHMRPILEQLYQNLRHQMLSINVSGELANSMRLVIHVVNSLLTTCK